MTGKKERPRFVLIFQIAAIFGAAMIFAYVIILMATSKLLVDMAAERGIYVANATAISAALELDEIDDFTIMTEEDVEEIQEVFHLICEVLAVKYLYLYDIDEKGTQTYYICAAGDKELNREINEEIHYGMKKQRPVTPGERKILGGANEIFYEFVDNEYGNVCCYRMPVISDVTGERIGFLGVDLEMDWLMADANNSRRIMIFAGFGTFIIAIIVSLLLVERSVVSPIKTLSRKMEGFVKDRNSAPAMRDTLFSDEITDIEASFGKMTEDISAYVGDIEKLSLEKAHNQTQLDVAKKIQSGMVPFERSMMGDCYEIHGSEKPAKEVGGDFYDFFWIDDNRICVCVGDISGKGISAALFMIMVKTVIRETARMGRTLDETMKFVNEEICASNPEFMFATVFVGVLDITTGVMQYANAGHEPPLLLGKDISFLEIDSGTALGIYEDAEMAVGEMSLSDGEGILIYTDGVTDSINTDHEHYGKERLLTYVKEQFGKHDGAFESDVLVKNLLRSVDEYANGMDQFDDITCVAAIYRKTEAESTTLSPEIKSFRAVKRTILNALGESDETKNIILAAEEIFSNVVSYSNADTIKYSCECKEGIYSITFIDNGIPFNPVIAQISEKSFEELDLGGMGIMLARKISKEMIYNRRNDLNYLTLKFDVPNDSKT